MKQFNYYKVEYWGGNINGIKRDYKDLKTAIGQAKRKINQQRKTLSCNAYAEIYGIDENWTMTLIKTIK